MPGGALQGTRIAGSHDSSSSPIFPKKSVEPTPDVWERKRTKLSYFPTMETSVFGLKQNNNQKTTLRFKWKQLLTSMKFLVQLLTGFPGGADGKESACQCRRHGFNPWVGQIPWRRAWQPISVFLRRTPWTEEPGGLRSRGLQRVGHDWSDLAHMHAPMQSC